MPASGSGHSHLVTTPTLSPWLLSGPFPRSIFTSLNHAALSAGGWRLALSLKVLKYSRWLSTPARASSSLVILLITRTTRQPSVFAFPPREDSTVTSVSAPPIFRVWSYRSTAQLP